MKRILGVLISSVMLALICLTALPVSAKEEYTEYIVPFYSDQTKQRQVLGISNKSLLKDGVVLIPLEIACEIADASIADEDDDAVIITRNYVSWCCEYEDTDKQYLLVDSNTGEGDYFEAALDNLSGISSKGIFGVWNPFDYSVEYDGFHVAFTIDDFHQTKIPCKFHDDKLYVSFYDFLVMMGVDVDLINHETISEITEFYTSMAEEYSDDEECKAVVSEFDKLFSAGTGYEQFFYCSLGTPIDELYKAYYDGDLMCDLGDYYGDGSVEWANLVNAVENYDGLTKTALAALNLNTDYEDVLINTVTYHGNSEDDNFSKTVDDSVDIIQRLLYVRDFGLSVEEIYRDDSILETVWKMQEKADNIEPILSSVDDFDVDFSLSPDAISMVYSGLCGAMKNYAKYREMSNLFEGEQYLMKNTILSSDAMARNTTDEARGMFISHILNPMGNVIEMHSNLRNEENSYFNLYHSAAKVQETMNASSPAAWAAVWGAIEEATYSAGDDLIMGVIDYTFFGGMPVSSLVNSGILFCVDGLKNTAYGKEQSQIAELDDYVFIQEVAKDCFKEHSLTSENAHSSFILGLKATMLAYESTNAGSSGEIHSGGGRSFGSDENSERKGYVPEELYGLLDQSVTANVDFYTAFPKSCGDLTEMLDDNTDMSNDFEIIDYEDEKDVNIVESENRSIQDYYEKTVREVVLGDQHSAAITDDGCLYLWGNNIRGQLGDGSDNDKKTPVKIMENVECVSLGYNHSAAITMDGGLYLWGDNHYGQLGDGTVEQRDTPIRIMDNVKSVSLGYEHSAAITDDGSLYVWGRNCAVISDDADSDEDIDSDDDSDSDDNDDSEVCNIPVKIMDNVKFVSLGSNLNANPEADNHSAAVTENGELFMWGYNDSGQLGDGTHDSRSTPVKIMDNVKSVSLGYNHSAAITEDGKLYLWGKNYCGQIGDRSRQNRYEPIEVMSNVKEVSLGWRHSAAITNDGDLYLWGDNYYGQLGNFKSGGDITSLDEDIESKEPVKILSNISTVSLGSEHSAAVTEGGVLYLWGSNKHGQIGSENENLFSHGYNEYGYGWGNNETVYVNHPIQIFPNYTSVISTLDISEYYGKYAATNGNLWLEITESENLNAEIFITFCNDSGSRVSESWFTGSVKTNPFTFKADDGWGNNSYTLEFLDGKILLDAKCLECTSGFWSIPDITGAVLQKEPTVINTATWQQLYAEELNNYISSHDYIDGAMFDLLDLDSDGIPELIISAGECYMCTCDIYGVKNGVLNLICKGISEWGAFTAYKDGVICATWTPSGPGQKITSTQFIKISNGSSEVLYDLTAEGFPPDYDKYTINGTEVSADEHDEVKMQYITQEPLQYSVGRKYTLDEGTINSVLLSSST